MSKITTILFDFDGVIANTEPQYDIYIEALGEKYNLGIKDFARQVKGTTTPNLVKKYFDHLPQEEQQQIINDLDNFELIMDFPLVEGISEFISYLKTNGYKIGLVTSSSEAKMKRALQLLEMEHTFDTIVTASRITQGKPNPMCFLLAADDLGSKPEDCIVFEDSFHGVKAGRDAGMMVVGVTTTLSEDELKDKTDYTIPDFSELKSIVAFFN
ncbi:HAD family phosphatase [Dysgonomonas sp. 511]|uniref:HAD family hydrolase n=1 Tax=Dysgonomonas sp. 511 TaxID=2302930 RepID=UPI0013D3C9C1|nr:HAD family phosphatase [Dysgonomonas sp. 511]NDV79382.1 HAD family phosphatase [Dysgonomonas sp. 511]